MLLRILAEFLPRFYRATTCVWSEDRRAARKKTSNFSPDFSTYEISDPQAMLTTGRGHGWSRPDDHVPSLSMVYIR